jgi:hypothetical protein
MCRASIVERRGEVGASLILALVFLTFFSLIATALVSEGFVSQRSKIAYQQVRDRDAAGSGAIQVAINRLSGSFNSVPSPMTATYAVFAQGRDPSNAATKNDPACVLNVPIGAFTITTTCLGDTNSGVPPTSLLPGEAGLQPRLMTIDACIRTQHLTTSTQMCGQEAGDQMLVVARVRFDVTIDTNGWATGTAGLAAANVPEVLEWNHVLLDGRP